MKPKSLKAYIRHGGHRRRVGRLLGRLRSQTLLCFVDTWAFTTSTPSAVAVASMVGQKTVRLRRRVDCHTIDHHEQTYQYLPFGSRVLDLKLDGGQALTTPWPPGINAFRRRGYSR